MKSTSIDIPVHDVAPLLEINEYSLVWFAVLVIGVLVVSYGVLKKMRLNENTKEVNARQQHYENLMDIDLTDPKKAAYTISREASFFARDNEQMLNTYSVLFKQLESYKYVPKAGVMDEECLALYRSYCQMIVV